MTTTFTLNGQPVSVDAEGNSPLLWVIRDTLDLKGTKFGCGKAACGACTVHVDGVATRTCVTPVEAADGASITTIEGLAEASGAREGELSALQAAWVAKQVPQCGYCQSGMLMAVSALLTENPQPTDEDIDAAITNVCRCGTYPRVRAAIRTVTSA